MSDPKAVAPEEKKIVLPLVELDGDKWIILKGLSNAFHVRAETITKSTVRVPDPSGHRLDQCHAEGSVKCRPKGKNWDISEYLKRNKG